VQTKVDSWTEEEPSYLIQEDMTAVHQYFATHRSQNRLEPEKRLMLAVLQDALFCFQRYFPARGGRRRKLFWESWQWFTVEGSDSVFAFENICEVLGLDASYIRRGLKLYEGLSGRFGRYKSAHLHIKNLNSSVEISPTGKFEDAGRFPP